MVDAPDTDDLQVAHLKATTVQLKINPSVIEQSDGEFREHSFRSISHGDSRDLYTVRMKAGETFFEIDGDVWRFDGIDYFPATDSEYLHQDVWESDVDLTNLRDKMAKPKETMYGDEEDFTLREFGERLNDGTIVPTSQPDD